MQVKGLSEAHFAMMALKRARLTMILGLLFRHTVTTSDPICSPSRSQSVQIMTQVARLASLVRLLSMAACFCVKSAQFPLECIRMTHWIDLMDDGHVKEGEGVARAPGVCRVWELPLGKMAKHGGDGEVMMLRTGREAVREVVILDVLILGVAL
jgi:hypothetical protein